MRERENERSYVWLMAFENVGLDDFVSNLILSIHLFA